MNSLSFVGWNLKFGVLYMAMSMENNSQNPIQKVTGTSIVHDLFQNGQYFVPHHERGFVLRRFSEDRRNR